MPLLMEPIIFLLFLLSFSLTFTALNAQPHGYEPQTETPQLFCKTSVQSPLRSDVLAAAFSLSDTTTTCNQTRAAKAPLTEGCVVLARNASAVIGMCGKMGSSIRCKDVSAVVEGLELKCDPLNFGRVGGTAEFSWGGILVYHT